MRIKLTKNMWGFNNEIHFKKGDEFNVQPCVNRFNIPVFKVTDGPDTGVAFNKKDCELITDNPDDDK